MSDERFPFLSAGWIQAARDLRAEYEDQIPETPFEVKINVKVTDIPHRDELDGHVDTSGGELVLDEGHLDDAELIITLDYETAKSAFVSRDPQAVMQSFLMGKIVVDGDVSQFFPLMQTMQPPAPGDVGEANNVADRMTAFTADD